MVGRIYGIISTLSLWAPVVGLILVKCAYDMIPLYPSYSFIAQS